MMIAELETDIDKPTKKMGYRTEEIARIERINLVSEYLIGKMIMRTIVLRIGTRHLLFNSVFPDNKSIHL